MNQLEYKANYIDQLRSEIAKTKTWADQNYELYKSIYHEKEVKWKNTLKTLRLAIEQKDNLIGALRGEMPRQGKQTNATFDAIRLIQTSQDERNLHTSKES